MQDESRSNLDPQSELHRDHALLDLADLMVRHYSLPDLFHEAAQRLRGVADFHLLQFSLYDPEEKRDAPSPLGGRDSQHSGRSAPGVHDLIRARSSAGKRAKLLLSWTPSTSTGAKEIRVWSGLTHEEMAQMIGASREMVTRLLSDLKKKPLIRLEGSTLVIRNPDALEALAS
jgi:CRP-like cAMP-binding protein